MTFMQAWNDAIEQARANNSFGYVFVRFDDGVQITARTMHASFMGGVPPKYDPERDAPNGVQPYAEVDCLHWEERL
jgi:hypothetical protein